MSTLQKRLQDELIGKDEAGGYARGVQPVRNKFRDQQRRTLRSVVSHIEADLKGLLGEDEPVDVPNYLGGGKNPVCQTRNELRAELRVAIERYCRTQSDTSSEGERK
jgi:hypothetical protein